MDSLFFKDGSDFNVHSEGSLTAIGTAEAKIIITNSSQTPGAWKGLEFIFSNDVKNELDYVVVEYGGGGNDGANIHLNGTTGQEQRLKLSNSLLQFSGSYGLKFGKGAIIDKFENNRVSNNDFAAGGIDVNFVDRLNSTSDFTGNNMDLIFITDSQLDVDQTWKKLNADYQLSNLSLIGNLSIEPGVKLIFEPDSQINVRSTGSLNATGTADQKIIFISTDEFIGSWEGIQLTFSDSANNKIIHSEIEYAGVKNSGAIFLLGNSLLFFRITIQNTRISFSDDVAILLDQDSDVNTDIETSNVFVDNARNIVLIEN